MNIFLTGATGHVGSAVLARLLEAGHTVHALARSEKSAATIRATGATVVGGDLTDTDVLARAAQASDGMIHTASPGDASSADVDTALLDAVLPVLSGKSYVHTSGIWLHGSGAELTETSPYAPPQITAWRVPLDARVRAAADERGVRSVVIAPGIVYGAGLGIPNVLVGGPTPNGKVQYPGGPQHWTTVHADDLADLYLAALTHATSGSYFFGVSGQNPTVLELAEAGAAARGLEGVEPEPEESARGRLGPMYEALSLDQQATGDAARSLGWTPTRPTLREEIAAGTYNP